MESPGNLACWFLLAHGLSAPVSYAELVEACRQDGLKVVVSEQRPRGRGYFINGPVDFILLREAGDAHVLAHEIAHWLTADPEGDYYIAAYAGAEEFAESFATALWGPPGEE